MLKTTKCKACESKRFDEEGYRTYTDYHCPVCNDTEELPLGPNDIVYVNVYSVTRHYGGPEEGGWYYNWYDCIEVFPVKNKASEAMQEELESEHAAKRYGNIYSVLGGRDILVYIEATPKESETKERPYYC